MFGKKQVAAIYREALNQIEEDCLGLLSKPETVGEIIKFMYTNAEIHFGASYEILIKRL